MSEDRREFMLFALRSASIRAKMWETEFNTVGVALKGGLITPEQALQMVKDMGGIDWLCTIPE